MFRNVILAAVLTMFLLPSSVRGQVVGQSRAKPFDFRVLWDASRSIGLDLLQAPKGAQVAQALETSASLAETYVAIDTSLKLQQLLDYNLILKDSEETVGRLDCGLLVVAGFMLRSPVATMGMSKTKQPFYSDKTIELLQQMMEGERSVVDAMHLFRNWADDVGKYGLDGGICPAVYAAEGALAALRKGLEAHGQYLAENRGWEGLFVGNALFLAEKRAALAALTRIILETVAQRKLMGRAALETSLDRYEELVKGLDDADALLSTVLEKGEDPVLRETAAEAVRCMDVLRKRNAEALAGLRQAAAGLASE